MPRRFLPFSMKHISEFFKRKPSSPETLPEVDAYDLLSNSLPFGVSLIDPDLNLLRSNDQMKEWFPRLNPDESQKCYQIFNDPPRTKPCPECRKHRVFDGSGSCEFIRRVRTTKGFRTLKLKSVPLRDRKGEFHGFLEIAEDITEQETREDSRKHYLSFLELLNRISAQIARVQDEDWNRRIHGILRELGEFFKVDRCCIFSLDPRRNLLSNLHEWCAPGISTQLEFLQELPESALPWWFQQLNALEPIHIPDIMELPPEANLERQELLRQDIKSILYFPMADEKGQCIGCIGFDAVREPRIWENNYIAMLKIFSSLLAGNLLRQSSRHEILHRESQYRQLVENSLNGVFTLELICDVDGTPLDLRVLNVNSSGAKIIHHPLDGVLGNLVSEVFPDLAAPGHLQKFSRLIRTGESQSLRLITHEPFRHLDLTAYALHGLQFAVIVTDNTEREKAVSANIVLQQQLNQAQKIESIGRLAGGVAHDFNNTLQVILGNAEMALTFQAPPPVLKNAFLEIRDAAKRSSTLTRQLLAFARKQKIEPKIVHLNESLQGMMKMIQRLIGEQITLEADLAEDLWPVLIDPGQVDQLLVNLCVNAGDAIADEGRIQIQTQNTILSASDAAAIPGSMPGEYVQLSVRDTGTGIPPEIRDHIFEPFLTTKAEGKGTGLGLATVHGIVMQNHGCITLESKMGIGTCFKIYLPRQHARRAAGPQKNALGELPRGTETVLVVEDEPTILQMTVMTLERLGYKTLSAASPLAALQQMESVETVIDLLLTDVVMPGMDGKELSGKLTRQRPGLRTLFMSGYTTQAIEKYGIKQTETSFIQKPFSVAEIALKLRTILDEPRS